VTVPRKIAPVLVVALLAAGCTSDDGEEAASRERTSSSTTAVSSTPSANEVSCDFTGVAAGGEVTWLEGANLMAAQNLRLSRPTGRSVLVLGGERIEKHENGAPDGRDITFVDRPAEVIYHPAGTAIVASGFDQDTPVLKIADNLGQEPKLLALGEEARSLGSLAFTASNALLFVADHGDESHLHRLELATGRLTTVATEKAPGHIGQVTTSPFPGGGVAWTQGPESSCRLVVTQDADFITVDGTPVASARPVGWLPDRSLVVHTAGCATTTSGTGDLFVVSATAPPRLLASGVTGPAVRAVLPTAVPPPAAIPEAPA
jgi:hypothetical protein